MGNHRVMPPPTPGPWKIQTDENGDRIVVGDEVMIVCRRPSPEDACLIATAPDLLGIAKAIFERPGDAHPGTDKWNLLGEIIARAEGKEAAR